MVVMLGSTFVLSTLVGCASSEASSSADQTTSADQTSARPKGRFVCREYDRASHALKQRTVVLEQTDNQHSRLPVIPAAKAAAAAGEVVYHWPEAKPREEAQVVVYEVSKRKLAGG